MKKLVCFSLAFLLSACSSKLAYNNLDWLIYWHMDDYIELNDAQEAQFDTYLDSWINWHRAEELAIYVEQMKQLKSDVVNDNLTKEVVLDNVEQARQHWVRIREKIAPQIALIALDVSDEQLIRFFAALEEDNKEEDEELAENQAKSEEERLVERIEDLTEDLEERIGDLTDEQHNIVAEYAPFFKSTHADWIEYRRSMQRASRKLFVTRPYNDDFVGELVTLINSPDDFRSERYKRNREKNSETYALLIADIAKVLTAKQKKKLLNEIQDIIDDLEDLME